MNSNYHRIRITGCLITDSALHVGSGEEKALLEGHYSAVCLDVHDKPYLPGSSLRGFLANTACRLKFDQVQQEALFGSITQNDQGQAGKLRIYDAPFRQKVEFFTSSSAKVELKQQVAKEQFEKSGTFFQTSTSINPILGVADEHHLFNLEIVPAGSCFDIEIVLEQADEYHLAQVLTLLIHWDGSTLSAIGGGSGKGRGRVKWQLEKIEVLDDKQLQAWLNSDDHNLSSHYHLLREYPNPVKLKGNSEAEIDFTLTPHGSFLLNDPTYVNDNKDNKIEGEPDLAYSRRPTGHAYIPATALRGWVRGRMRRILLSLLMETSSNFELSNKRVDSLVDSLFGTTGQRGKLWFNDAISETIPEPFSQTFNAVDRFTSGVAKTALYSVEAARCQHLKSSVWLQGKLADWEKGILLLIARDLLEGELMLGWGKSRGYGSFSVKFNHNNSNISDHQALKEHFQANASDWLTALKNHITATP